ncbi:MAG: FHA domain-containing protein [Bacteroidales bacterium]|nr:FHA domain-containing protein [Bacteroidales bacterium]
MKSYSIGREETCNIIVNDPTQMVSRMHATLNVDGGKMTIVDNSTNGTYINGIRIQKGAPVPVSRKDVVSFAQVAELDWNCVPRSDDKLLYTILAVLLCVLLAGGLSWYFLTKDNQPKHPDNTAEEVDVWKGFASHTDSLKADVTSLKAAKKTAEDDLAKLRSSLEAKDRTKKKDKDKVEQINKNIWQIEELLKNVDTDDFDKSISSVEQSIADKSSNTEERLKTLAAKTADAKETIKKVEELLKTTKDEINKLPDPKHIINNNHRKKKDTTETKPVIVTPLP